MIEIVAEISGLNVFREILFEHSREQILMREETMQPQSSYLICATPFDGSTLLCNALKSTGVAGYPEEYFGVFEQVVHRRYRGNAAPTGDKTSLSGYWNEVDFANSLARAFEKGMSYNSVFGAKVLWDYFDNLICNIRRIPMYGEMPVSDLLPAIFPNLQYIWFLRENTVQQAISLWKAAQISIWNLVDAKERQFVFNFEAIDGFVQQIVEREKEWLRFFVACDIQPFIIAYEELVNNYEGTMRQLMKYLRLSPSASAISSRPPLEQHTDAMIEFWCERYYQIKQKYSSASLPARYKEEYPTLDF